MSQVRITRELYLLALSDAIDWRQSLVDSCDETDHSGHYHPPHCGLRAYRPDGTLGTERCEQYQINLAVLKRYKAARARLLSRKDDQA